MEKKVLVWYANKLAAKHQGKKREKFLKELKKESFLKTIAAHLSKDMKRAATDIGECIKYNTNTAPVEITDFLRGHFLGVSA